MNPETQISYWIIVKNRLLFKEVRMSYQIEMDEVEFRGVTKAVLTQPTEGNQLNESIIGQYSGLNHRRLNILAKAPTPTLKVRSKYGDIINKQDVKLKCLIIPKEEGINFVIIMKDYVNKVFVIALILIGLITLAPPNLIRYVLGREMIFTPFFVAVAIIFFCKNFNHYNQKLSHAKNLQFFL